MFRINKNNLISFIDSHIIHYPTPSNLNYYWSFGSAAGIALVIQILTGIFLTMHYTSNIEYAFASIEHIMRDVNGGWLMRYLHANGASFFFILIYCHIFRGIYFGSYIEPRSKIWISGVIIFLAMMATAFMGYVLPWGQMSFWGATVITNLFSAIPVIGTTIVEWLWGGFSVSNATLNRFLSLHYLLPFIIIACVLLHLNFLHEKGSNNPLGIDRKTIVINFHPYFTVKDLVFFLTYMFFFIGFVCFAPNTLGHPDNYIDANPLVTPAHIVPEWYFLPFYAILRSIPNKLGGVIAMVSAILVLLVIPYNHSSQIKNIEFRPLYQFFFWLLFVDFLLLGWIGQEPVETPYMEIGLFCTIYYFLTFLVIFPVCGIIEKTIYNYNILKNEK